MRPGDRVALEGDNQKQADFLSRTLADCDPKRLNDLHMLISSVSRPEHLDLFDRGIATKLDLAYAGPQSVRIAQMVEDGTVHIGAIHTYVELYARMFVDLAPDVALLCAEQADRDGNLYTGPEHRGHPDDRRGRRLPRRRGDRAGRRDRRHRQTSREWTSRAAGSTSSSRPTGRSSSSRCSPATRATSATSRSSRR